MDQVVSIHPYFKVNDGKMDAFKTLWQEFIDKTQTEEKVLYYGFSVCGDMIHCREAYIGAEGLLAHIENVGDTIAKALEISSLVRCEIHGNEDELSKLREPLADLGAEFYTLKCGIRK